MKHRAFMVLGVWSAATLCLADSEMRWDTATTNQIALRSKGEDVWRFHFDPAKEAKPFFDPVCVAGGPSLTWASPPDHAWHHAFWFAWKHIDGVNYWEERNGKSQGETFWSQPKISTQPDGRAAIELELGYRPTPAGAPVLRERRTIVISAPDADGAYAMDWTQVFTAGDRAVTLDAPGGYTGLSVRFAEAFSNVETVVSSVGRVLNPQNRLNVIGAAADQNGVVGGKPYGIAMLVHPDNPRAPGDWFVVDRPQVPFHYFNASFPMRGAQTFQPGETLTLRYRVQIHPGRWNAEDLRQATKRYVATAVAADKIRVLLLTGANNHDWRTTTAALMNLFAQDSRFTVAVNERPWEMKPADLQGYNLVFSNWNTFSKKEEEKRAFEWNEAMRAAFLEWVRNGGGLFVLHSGGCLFYDWTAFQSLTGGAWEKETFHPKMQTFRVNLADKAHPVTRGMADFETFDEPWQHIGNRNPGRRVLATGVVAKENGGSGEPEPFAFVTELGKGRCFNLVLGHDAQSLGNAGCRTLVLRGAEWAATGEVR